MKKLVLSLVIVGVLTVGVTVSAFADEIVSRGFRHTGTTAVETLMEEGLTFEEAKSQRLESNLERVDAALERGTITEEEAAKIKVDMESNSSQCTTPGEKQGSHEGYGLNQGLNGKGQGNGKGARIGLGKASCTNN